MSFTQNAKFLRLSGAIAGATTDVTNLTSVDMTGYQGVTFMAAVGTVAASAVTSVKVQQSTDDTNWSDLEGSSISIADDDDDTLVVSEVVYPNERYCRLYIDRGTATAAFDGVYAIQTGPKSGPVTQSTTHVSGIERHLSPSEGTA